MTPIFCKVRWPVRKDILRRVAVHRSHDELCGAAHRNQKAHCLPDDKGHPGAAARTAIPEGA